MVYLYVTYTETLGFFLVQGITNSNFYDIWCIEERQEMKEIMSGAQSSFR